MMVPNNVQKFQYTDNQRENFKNLSQKALTNSLIICPSQKAFYAWNIPEDSPDSYFGCWSKLINISPGVNDQPMTLWDRNINNMIKSVVMNKEDLYYVPMNQVYYAHIHNHNLYVQDNNINYLIDFDNVENLFKVSRNEDICYMYNLSTNTKINYILDAAQNMWSGINPIDVQEEGGWNVCYTPPQDDLDETNEIMKLINEAYDLEKEENFIDEKTGEMNPNLVYNNNGIFDDDNGSEYTDSDDCSDTDTEEEEEEEEPTIAEGTPVNVKEGTPINVNDNLPDWGEEEEEEYRMDETNGRYYTKAEFIEYYGDKKMWKAMHPKKKLRRYSLYYANYYASYLSLELRQKFIKEYLKTF